MTEVEEIYFEIIHRRGNNQSTNWFYVTLQSLEVKMTHPAGEDQVRISAVSGLQTVVLKRTEIHKKMLSK